MAQDISEETPEAGEMAAKRRKERRRRVLEANKVTLILDTGVRKFMTAQARAAGMDVSQFTKRVIEAHVVSNAPEGDPLAARLAAKQAVLDRAVAVAGRIDAEGGFDEHFVLNVLRTVSAEPGFQELYDKAVGAGDETVKRPKGIRAALNQLLGRLIKRVAGARSKRDAAGKIQRAQVQGEILSTYTLLEKPDA